MVNTIITADEAPSDRWNLFRAKWNTSKDRRHWTNITNAVANITLDLTTADQWVVADGSSAVVGITLPASDSSSAGMTVYVFVEDTSNAVTLIPDGSDTINGLAATSTLGQGDFVTVRCLGDGNWVVLSENIASGAAPKTIDNTDSPYTVLDTDGLILADATSGAITVNLPTAVGRPGRQVAVKKVDASGNAVTVDGAGSETIDGSLTEVITVQYNSPTMESDNANWWIR